MKKFKVRFHEVIIKEVIIEAKTPTDAEKVVEDGYFFNDYEIDIGGIVINEVEEIE